MNKAGQDFILIIDFGSQYTQLIARKVREQNVYCEIYPYNNIPEFTPDLKGIILSGSPFSCKNPEAPAVEKRVFETTLPVLGICYSAQYMAHHYGGEVIAAIHREYGRAHLQNLRQSPLFERVEAGSQVWMSHGDTIVRLPAQAQLIASTETVENAAFFVPEVNFYGIQFHPEVHHTTVGTQLLHNFLFNICGCTGNWNAEHFIDTTVENIRQRVGNQKVLMGLSGGVDSTVAAALIDKAIGDNLYCIFVNNGLLRKNEFDDVLHSYKDMGLNIKGVDASDRFYNALFNLTDPEQKRKAIGRTFIEVFEDEASKLPEVHWLGQGTIYPDRIESVSVKGPSATIKSHHNVGGLPDIMRMQVLEPLETLFKDEVRKVGRAMDLPENIMGRHPFPGPGLAIRILGDVTAQKVQLLQQADDIFIKTLKKHNLYDEVWQAGAILLPVHSVGVMGDERTYEQVICLRAVTSVDGMTADWVSFSHHFLAEVSNRIINEVKGINRVVYDVSSKPPATIEWE